MAVALAVAVIKWITIRAGVGLAAALLVSVAYFATRTSAEAELDVARALRPPPIRDVRVLIASGAGGVRVRASGGVVIREAGQRIVGSGGADGWIAVKLVDDGGFTVNDATYGTSELWLDPADGGTVFVRVLNNREWSQAREYFGRLQLLARADGSIDVINHVDVERYVACVTAREVWPTFHEEAFRGQAIVARSYVLYHMLRRNSRDFDVTATQGSQVYRGVRRDSVGRRAAAATLYTRGVVLTWSDVGKNRLFCTYYSAACGGMSQSAAIFDPAGDIQPLSGSVACDYCRIAPGNTYRWGPVKLDETEIFQRVARRYPELEPLGRLRGVEVVEATPDGRAVTVRLHGAGGASHDMLAERFRQVVGPSVLKSTHFRLRDFGASVVFEDGQGFGHGLGLCQWGMEAQAESGRSVTEILEYYYPGARLTRVY